MSLFAPSENCPAGTKTRNTQRTAVGVHVDWMPFTGGYQGSLTVKPARDSTLRDWVEALGLVLAETESVLAHATVFGRVNAHAATVDALRNTQGAGQCPITWVEGASCDGQPIAGMQAVVIAGLEAHPLRIGNEHVASIFEAGGFRHCLVGGIGPGQNLCSRTDQAQRTLERLEQILERAGFPFEDVIRTWFFLEDILAWYGEFNRVRTQHYADIAFRTGSLPASTGVGGRNPNGDALVTSVWAAQPLDNSTSIEEIASPLQCPAPAYGSSFSRAMELASSAGRQLTISGTASIAPDGRTMCQDDPRGQMDQTLEVIEAILKSRGFGFEQLVRATAYFKRTPDAELFDDLCEKRGVHLPHILNTQCSICRDDLLFEIEADAWRPA